MTPVEKFNRVDRDCVFNCVNQVDACMCHFVSQWKFFIRCFFNFDRIDLKLFIPIRLDKKCTRDRKIIDVDLIYANFHSRYILSSAKMYVYNEVEFIFIYFLCCNVKVIKRLIKVNHPVAASPSYRSDISM